MKRKILRCLWLIPLIVGICLGIAGIVKIKEANNMFVPEMGEDGWFDASSEQTSAKMKGYVMVGIGFAFLPIIAFAVGVGVKQSTTTPEEEAEAMAKEINKNKRYKQKLKELAGEEAAEKYDYDDSNEEDTEDDLLSEYNENVDENEISSQHKTTKKAAKASTESVTKFCDFCGSANTQNATKCSSCGASFTSKRK